jgi:regulator of RNase E activity RraA
MSTAARNRGAVGAVLTRGILELGFPTFSMGRHAQDQRPRGKVVDYRCRIHFGEVVVEPGDLVFGDIDGVCVVPKAIKKEVISKALEKAQGERRVFNAIHGGLGAQAAWDKFGIM